MNNNPARQTLDRIKELLLEEESASIMDLAFENNPKVDKEIVVYPYTHNEDQIILQFYGWSINLLKDGTYIWEATDGG